MYEKSGQCSYKRDEAVYRYKFNRSFGAKIVRGAYMEKGKEDSAVNIIIFYKFEVYFTRLFVGNYDRPTDRQTDRPTDMREDRD